MFELPVEGTLDRCIASESCLIAWTWSSLRNNTVPCNWYRTSNLKVTDGLIFRGSGSERYTVDRSWVVVVRKHTNGCMQSVRRVGCKWNLDHLHWRYQIANVSENARLQARRNIHKRKRNTESWFACFNCRNLAWQLSWTEYNTVEARWIGLEHSVGWSWAALT
jgi:hypothetical protein